MHPTDPPATTGLALFDVDGTLTTEDTMFAFARSVVGPWGLGWALVRSLPWLVAMKLGLADRGATKARMLRLAFAGHDKAALEAAARRFCRESMPRLLRPRGRDALTSHQAQGDRVVLVSASLDLWLAPWARVMGVELLCTATRWEGERFAGIAGANCRGAEKVRRVEALIPQRPDRVAAYGDSSGDAELLAWADEGHMKPFHD